MADFRGAARSLTEARQAGPIDSNLLTIVARLESKAVSLRVLSMSDTQPLDSSKAAGRLMLSVIAPSGKSSARRYWI